MNASVIKIVKASLKQSYLQYIDTLYKLTLQRNKKKSCFIFF